MVSGSVPGGGSGIDVTDDTFSEIVLTGSREIPVVVDFWAPWCGPCRQLTPIIERVASRFEGDVVLVKVNVDENPLVASQMRIQGIPAVRAFRAGDVVAQFEGLVSEDVLMAFFQGLVPSEVDRLVAAGDENSLRDAIERDGGRTDARIALGRILIGDGRVDEAAETLGPARHDATAEGLLARLALASNDAPDVQAALAALGRGDEESALTHLLDAIAGSSGDLRETLRQAIVGVFLELGDQHPLTVRFRRRLAQTLY